MISGSISRYSTEYWANYYINNLSGTSANAVNKKSEQIDGFANRKKVIDKKAAAYNWKAVGQADVDGAVGGAVIGAVSACLTGAGCAAAPGTALVGGVAGAAGTSAQQAVQELFNWW